MFRKPKRSAKASLRSARRKVDDDDEDEHDHSEEQNYDDDDDEPTTKGLFQGSYNKNKRLKKESSASNANAVQSTKQNVLQQFTASSSSSSVKAEDLATLPAQHHPEQKSSSINTTTADGRGADGIYREKTRNPFLAGPIRASTNVRTTCRFDYQPDVCKDYKDTGFCGYGDTCIYLHDRGDTLTGWQIEEQWQEQQKLKQQQQQADMEAFADGTFQTESGSNIKKHAVDDSADVTTTTTTSADDGLPFACHICRQPFADPIVTSCHHYFCEKCIVEQVRSSSSDSNCPICRKDTHGVFNQPTKLLAKKRRLLGAKASWKEFAEACSSGKA